MTRKILLMICIFSLISSVAFAAGTDKNATVTANITALSAVYDAGSGAQDLTLDKGGVGDLVKTVIGVYGIRTNSGHGSYTMSTPVAGSQGQVKSRAFVVTNWANDSDTITFVTASEAFTPQTGDTSVLADWLATTALDDYSEVMAEDADKVVAVSVTYPVGVVKGSTYNISIGASTAAGNVDTYSGYNGNSYGGYASRSAEATFYVDGAPYLELISRTSVVVAPGAQGSSVVPGAKIKYTIVLENKAPTATVGAMNITITDATPANTKYFAGEDSYIADNGVTFTAPAISNLATGAVTWAHSNTNALMIGSRITVNYTVVID